jgi:hypothetical protein
MAGRRAFHRGSAAETMTAIIREEPEGRVPLIQALDVRHFFNRHPGYVRTPEKLQGNSAGSGNQHPAALSKQFQDLIEPSQDCYFRHYSACFSRVLRNASG